MMDPTLLSLLIWFYIWRNCRNCLRAPEDVSYPIFHPFSPHTCTFLSPNMHSRVLLLCLWRFCHSQLCLLCVFYFYLSFLISSPYQTWQPSTLSLPFGGTDFGQFIVLGQRSCCRCQHSLGWSWKLTLRSPCFLLIALCGILFSQSECVGRESQWKREHKQKMENASFYAMLQMNLKMASLWTSYLLCCYIESIALRKLFWTPAECTICKYTSLWLNVCGPCSVKEVPGSFEEIL